MRRNYLLRRKRSRRITIPVTALPMTVSPTGGTPPYVIIVPPELTLTGQVISGTLAQATLIRVYDQKDTPKNFILEP